MNNSVEWNRDDDSTSVAQGWGLFALDGGSEVAIQRIDDLQEWDVELAYETADGEIHLRFSSDAEAIEYVNLIARAPSDGEEVALCRKALAILAAQADAGLTKTYRAYVI